MRSDPTFAKTSAGMVLVEAAIEHETSLSATDQARERNRQKAKSVEPRQLRTPPRILENFGFAGARASNTDRGVHVPFCPCPTLLYLLTCPCHLLLSFCFCLFDPLACFSNTSLYARPGSKEDRGPPPFLRGSSGARGSIFGGRAFRRGG